jgi:predicted nucleotidyltransferase
MSRSIGRTNEVSLSKIKQTFKNLPEVRVAVLFGSRVLGETNPQSDYDIAVLMKQPRTGLEDPFYTLYADLPVLLDIQECDLDLIDLRKADSTLKQSIRENYLIIKGHQDEISRLFAED